VAVSDFEAALDSTDEVDLSTTGRVSGRLTSRPVWFVREDGRLFLLPVTGARSQWYRNLLKTPAIRLTAGGSQFAADAAVVTEPGTVEHIVERFRAKYGAGEIAKYYQHPDVAVEVSLRVTGA
jgi:deazaflavin-dependent oxidoreductase (nitroreductase family)